jgi:hypothetical protein
MNNTHLNSFKQYHNYRGKGIFSSTIGALGAYKAYNAAKNTFNWVGSKISNASNALTNNPIYQKTMSFVSPERNFNAPKKVINKEELLPTLKTKEGLAKYTLDFQGREKPALNSDPFRKYDVQDGKMVTTQTPLGKKIFDKNLQTKDQKETQSFMNKVNFDTKYEKSVLNPDTKKIDIKEFREKVDPFVNPRLKPYQDKWYNPFQEKSPAQLILDRVNTGKGIKRKSDNTESFIDSKKQFTFVS